MSDFGYDMVKHEKNGGGVIFRLRADVNTEGKKNPVTIRYPDFVMSDGKTPAFERSYVIDLLSHTLGVGDNEVVARIIARRQLN